MDEKNDPVIKYIEMSFNASGIHWDLKNTKNILFDKKHSKNTVIINLLIFTQIC